MKLVFNANNALCCFPEILTENYVMCFIQPCTHELMYIQSPTSTYELLIRDGGSSQSQSSLLLARPVHNCSIKSRQTKSAAHASIERTGGEMMVVVMVSNITFLGCWMILEGLATGSVIICVCIPPIWTGFFDPPLVTVKLT